MEATSTDGTPQLSGVDRTAVLLLSVGEQHAAEVLRHMSPREVQRIGAAMAGISRVRREQMQAVLMEFCELADAETAFGLDSGQFVRNVLERALGKEKAAGLMDRILGGGGAKGVEALRWMDARAVALALRQEHPQVIAIVLSYLDSTQSAYVIKMLPDADRHDVMMRLATLDEVPQKALAELNEVIEKEVVARVSAVASSKVGGTRKAAEIMNSLESEIEESILEHMREVDETLATDIVDQMFVFENLLDADDRGIQALLREIQSDRLLVALKGADEAVREKVFGNMSKRAAQALRDDLEIMRPMKLSEVEAAQREILEVVKRLADAGDIVLSRGGADFV